MPRGWGCGTGPLSRTVSRGTTRCAGSTGWARRHRRRLRRLHQPGPCRGPGIRRADRSHRADRWRKARLRVSHRPAGRSRPVDRRPGAGRDRPDRQGRRDDRHLPGRHRPPDGRRAAQAGPPHGVGRPPRRRRRARSQQSDDGGDDRVVIHPRQARPSARGSGRRRAHSERSRANRRGDRATPGVQPAAAPQAPGAESQCRGRKVPTGTRAHSRRGLHGDAQTRARARPGARRSRTDRAGAAQPDAQRARCHAARRHALGRDRRSEAPGELR